MFRWLRFSLLFLLTASALGTALLWLRPSGKSGNIMLGIADERTRWNLYCSWGTTFWHLRAFPPPGYILPNRYVLLVQVMDWDGPDVFSVSFRPVSETRIPTRMYWHAARFRAYQQTIDSGEGWLPQAFYDFEFPMWFVVVTLSAYPVLALVRGPLRRSHRHRRGRCIQCGYDLTGLPEQRCPECGTPFGSTITSPLTEGERHA